MEKKETVRPRGTDSAKVIQVIETVALLGRGTEEDPLTEVHQYWSLDGKPLASSHVIDDEDFVCFRSSQ